MELKLSEADALIPLYCYYVGSPQLITIHLGIIQSYNGSEKVTYDEFSLLHGYVIKIQMLGN